MKDLSPKNRSRHWHRIHRKNLNKRAQEGRGSSKKNKTRESVTIKCPSDFSLDTNFGGVVKVLRDIRRYSTRQRNENLSLYVDFCSIITLSPAATLVLAAELDRWNYLLQLQEKGKKLAARDVEQWNPTVKHLLGDMGFFELLKVDNPLYESNNAPTRYAHFRTGEQAQGAAIHAFQENDLRPLLLGEEIPSKPYLYSAVIEAMTNVAQHAYSGGAIRPNWWLSASYNALEKETIVMLFDQGIGIPETLPREFPESVLGIDLTSHARIIKAAHELPRSSSEQKNRGKGLGGDIRAYLNRPDCAGSYRVTSLRGQYIFQKNLDGDKTEDYKTLKHPLVGTLIEWRLYL